MPWWIGLARRQLGFVDVIHVVQGTSPKSLTMLFLFKSRRADGRLLMV